MFASAPDATHHRDAAEARMRDVEPAHASGDRSRPWRSGERAAPLLLRDDHCLDRRGRVFGDIDDDHVRADVLDRLGQMHVASVDFQSARFSNRGHDVLRGHRAEQAAVRAGLLRDREHRAVEQADVLLRAFGRVALRALFCRLALADRFDRAARRRLGELARQEVIAQVALRYVDDGALLAEVLDLLEEYRFGHRRLSLAVAVAVAAFAPRAVVAPALVDVRQQRELASALDSARDLDLVTAARAGDPPRADLALLGDELAQRRDVLVVDLLDFVAAVLARLSPAARRTALLVAAPNRLAAPARLRH